MEPLCNGLNGFKLRNNMPKSDFSRKFLRLLKPETKKYYLFFEIFTFKNNLKFVTLYSSQSFFIGKACIHVPQF